MIAASLALFVSQLTVFSPARFLVGFLVFVCVLAIVIIACRWLLSLTGIAIPQPLLVILGIIVFLLLLLVLLNWSGLYAFGLS
jgi:hypothetical protein